VKKCGKEYCGYPVKSIEEVREYRQGEYFILITLSNKIASGVKKDLLDKKIFSAIDFYDEAEDPLHIMRFFMTVSPNAVIFDTVSKELKNNFRCIDGKDETKIKEGVLRYLYKEIGGYSTRAFQEHMFDRLEDDRRRVIPWLDNMHKLNGASVLEIGCGTGASTVTLCEQKAEVTAIDVDESAIEAANIRMDAYNLKADIRCLNAVDMLDAFCGKCFDFVIFYASLEHMTFDERINALRAAFEMLKPGGNVVLVEIPNRLWYIDEHTSKEPFYNWLPDLLAMEYSRYTQRKVFNNGFDAVSEVDVLNFARWGRGVSYHEIEIALGGKDRFRVRSSLGEFLKLPESTFKRLLKMIGPSGMHEGFYDPWLYIALYP